MNSDTHVAPSPSAPADARLDLRLSPPDKALMEHAAKLRGMPLSAFVRAAALREARDVLAAEAVVLSPTESRLFIRALNRPLQTNAKLTKALDRLAGES